MSFNNDGLVYVRVRDGDVARTEQVTDTIRLDWSATNGAGEAELLGVEVLDAIDVEVDGQSVTEPVAIEGDKSSHRYLSTGCLHGEHGYCQSMTGQQGEKRPGVCKFCDARCVCSCHAQVEA